MFYCSINLQKRSVWIHFLQINHSNPAISVGSKKELFGLEVTGACPECVISYNIPILVLFMIPGCALGDIEVVQNMKCLNNSIMIGL